MNVLLFTGAGASVELGIPAMWNMAHELYAFFNRREWPNNLLSRFDHLLRESDFDLESFIELIETVERGEQGRQQLRLESDDDVLHSVRMMRWETEWYLQHSCERIRMADASVLWGSTLRRADNHDICIVTTNYDRAIENACEIERVSYDDGFARFREREYAEWNGIDSSSRLKLIKIHGSTDWYRDLNGRTYKLKHPMPLYGELFVSARDSGSPELTSAMVLPTREKLINHPPYPDLVTEFRNTARIAEIAFFVGTSLRDPDILDIYRQCRGRIPTYRVNQKPLETDAPGEFQDKYITDTASGFLISTLPRFLETEDSALLDSEVDQSERSRRPVLSWLKTVIGREDSVDRICKAIDRLVYAKASLDSVLLGKLLSHSDMNVRKYALALIPHSVDRESALQIAIKKVLESDDPDLRREFEILKELLGSID